MAGHDSIIHLNVGGKLFSTTSATLLGPAAAGSMLERMATLHTQGQQQAGVSNISSVDAPPSASSDRPAKQPLLAPTTISDALFIDRDGGLFSFILSYLRNAGEMIAPDDLVLARQLLCEAKYYKIGGLIAQLQQHIEQLQQRATQHTSALLAATACQAELVRIETSMEKQHQQLLHKLSGVKKSMQTMCELLDDLKLVSLRANHR